MATQRNTYSYPPRGMRREAAAAYIGVSTSKFDETVADGRMPTPKRIDGCVIWDRYQIDAAFDDLSNGPVKNPFDRMLESTERAGSNEEPPEYRAMGRRVYEDGEWEDLVRKSPLTKLEAVALPAYVAAKGTLGYIKGAGPATIGRLVARGFIHIVQERDGGRVPFYGITPAGESEWQRLEKERFFAGLTSCSHLTVAE